MRLSVAPRARLSRDSSCSSLEEKRRTWTKRGCSLRQWARQCITWGARHGASMKMVNNLILAQAMVAFSEALVLGESLGISKQALFNTLLSSPTVAPFLAFKKQKIEEGKFDVEFPLQWMHKDLQLAAETAYEIGVAMPAANVTKEIYALALRGGLGEQDFSAVYKVLSERK